MAAKKGFFLMHVHRWRETVGAAAFLALLNAASLQQCYAAPPNKQTLMKLALERRPPQSAQKISEITKWAESAFWEEWHLHTVSTFKYGAGLTPQFVVIVGQNYSGDLDPDVFLYAKVKETKISPWRLAFSKIHAYRALSLNDTISGAYFDAAHHRVRLIASNGKQIYSIDTSTIETKMK
ncbi:MAG: hypothetical protein ABIY70_22080 [Capsulimonas sp.]|uniref:hypothetical protein n=1 Tax=Capsulimonas sp. TaxID=2494211 RepID=UPI003263CF11